MAGTKNRPGPKIRLKVKVTLLNEEGRGFLGAGHYELLRRISSSHSISGAAREMGMSYAKAHRILHDLEKNSVNQILLTHIGGMDRGGAELTPFACTLIAAYEQFIEEVQEVARKRFQHMEKLFTTKWMGEE
ncbi:MAG: ModE family transcriptional regulator [bacterium]